MGCPLLTEVWGFLGKSELLYSTAFRAQEKNKPELCIGQIGQGKDLGGNVHVA